MLLHSSLAPCKVRFSLLASLAAAAIIFVFLAYQFTTPFRFPLRVPRPATDRPENNVRDFHPIRTLIDKAGEEWKRLLKGETHDVASAAEEYRKRRGRHPPPLFDQWFDYAKRHNAVVVEEFFDPIYHDLNPFWAVNATDIRLQADTIMHRVVVRNHTTTTVTEGEHDWVPAWASLIESIQGLLPDVIVPINVMDEPRLVVPWEEMTRFVEIERKSRHLPDPNHVVATYAPLEPPAPTQTTEKPPDPTTSGATTSGAPEATEVPAEPPFDPQYLGPGDGPYWEMIIRGCPPDSSGRKTKIPQFNFTSPPPEFDNYLRLSENGYVSNWTQSKDPCIRPELQRLHGNFIEPLSISTSHRLFPLFGGSKLPMNNEILLPAAMYWAEGTVWSGDGGTRGGPWEDKSDVLVWRGAATGGRNKNENWRHFHRHRFISMVNGTSVDEAETGRSEPANFVIPDYDSYNLTAALHGHLPEFLSEHVDAGFVHLVCFPDSGGPRCPYADPYFSIAGPIPMKKQFQRKYLPDIDGNSFSGRYREFLLSTSIPIKATVYNEWHDARLVPWAHFVPMDSTFMDIYGILEYFIGTDDLDDAGAGLPGHDAAAEKIAMDGKEWSEKVLRKEDMKIYVYRLLLEYARVSDDQRELMGFVDDLIR